MHRNSVAHQASARDLLANLVRPNWASQQDMDVFIDFRPILDLPTYGVKDLIFLLVENIIPPGLSGSSVCACTCNYMYVTI